MSIRVKFLTKHPDRDVLPGWRKFLPHGDTRVGDCEFLFDRDERNYDWLAVYDDLPAVSGERFTLWEERLACPRENTLLITTEPSSIKIYGSAFLRQFGHVLTSQEPWVIGHPGAIRCQAGLIRFYEGDYDAVLARSPEKTAAFSTVCSSKQQRHTLHHLRYSFTQRLKAAMPELEIFGHGVRAIDEKNEALDAYRYHLAIENHIAPHHWTEKLSDPFLSLSLPFYFGAPNAADYFPPESFIPIDINRFDDAVSTIRAAIEGNEYERRLPAIREAKQLAMEKWSTFPQLARIIGERHNPDAPQPGKDATILSRHLHRRHHPVQSIGLLGERAWVRARFMVSNSHRVVT